MNVEVLGRLASRQLSLAEAAAHLECSEARALELLQVYEVSRGAVAEEHRRLRAGVLRACVGVAAVSALAFVTWSLPAFAQSCTASLPAPLVAVCPDEPALASVFNGNFQQVVTWSEQKLGTVGTANITAAGSLTFSGAGRQALTMQSTDYGLGLQNATLYQRTGGGFAWYRGGAYASGANDPGAGGSTLMTLSNTGALGIGYHINTCANTTECACNAGSVALGGGVSCDTTFQSVYWSRPAPGGGSWQGICYSNAVVTPVFVFAVCARIGG